MESVESALYLLIGIGVALMVAGVIVMAPHIKVEEFGLVSIRAAREATQVVEIKRLAAGAGEGFHVRTVQSGGVKDRTFVGEASASQVCRQQTREAEASPTSVNTRPSTFAHQVSRRVHHRFIHRTDGSVIASQCYTRPRRLP